MFYSEQLLAKTGPLARVWLASNVERKLTKSQILQSDISSSVNVIVDQTAAPLALRLSGQLMLGVVRIYNRKSKYLLDDANEALLKIRMTFKKANSHDLPAQPHVITTIEVQDDLTMEDLFPALDFGIPMLTQQAPRLSQERTLEDEDWLSSLEPHTQTPIGIEEGIHDADLGIDIGADVGMEDTTISIEVGRGRAAPRPEEAFAEPAIEEGEGLEIDLGEDVPMPDLTRISEIPIAGAVDETRLQLGEDETMRLREAAERPESPLSEAESEVMRELAETFGPEEQIEEVQAAQRPAARRRKPLVPDLETVLDRGDINAWLSDRSKITRPLTLLPQDPELLALMEMQRTGGFVTNAMTDGLSRGVAPELQGLLTFEIAYRSGQKRKRDSGIADVTSEDEGRSPRRERPSAEIEEQVVGEDEGIDLREPELPEALEPGFAEVLPEEAEEGVYVPEDFDETRVPLVHPADGGPISVGTRHAVHLLRETFGGTPESGSPQPQLQRSILLQDLIPEARTSREDATKMFFEILVLATKDAIKVEQDSRELGLPIRVRARRGLWGEWAEPPAEGETQRSEIGVGA